jgi:hypothetical protein
VQDVRWHREPGEPAGCEFRMLAADGQERYLAIETFEEEWEDSEGDEHTRYPRFILLDCPLSDEQYRQLEGSHTLSTIAFDDGVYYYDRENSGASNMETTFEGETYTSRYHARVYLPRPFPKESSAGIRLLEYVVFDGGQDPEWSVMEILTWHDIDFVRVIGSM